MRRSRIPTMLALAIAWLVSSSATQPSFAQTEEKLQIKSLRLGFEGVYRLGCWTQLAATIDGADQPLTGRLVVRCLDADGVPTEVVTAPDRPVGVVPGRPTVARVFFRQGRSDGRFDVRLVVDGETRARREFRPGQDPGARVVPYPKPSTSRIVLSYGPLAGLATVVEGEQVDPDSPSTAVSVESPEDLPLDWYGYESINVVVLSTSDPTLYRSLTSNSQRIAALEKWIEMGGRLVLFCGANAPELIGPSGPLVAFVPGEFSNEMQPVSDLGLQSLDKFTSVSSEDALPRGRSDLQAPRIVNVRGSVLAYDGQDPENLPLVVRTRRGAGDVTFVALDPNAAPFHDWSARTTFVSKALEWSDEQKSESDAGAYQQSDDLIVQLRSALDRQFADVATAPFALVALLVIAYIIWIGPVDYFIVRRLLNRMEATWITFPLFVLVASTAAYWLAHWMKGDKLRVNQVEIVDVDVENGVAQGVVWTHFFSPRVDLYDLSLQPNYLGDQSPDDAESVVAWLGVPGLGLGGMEGQSGASRVPRGGYSFSPELDQLFRLPVQEWSTKTITGRWSGRVQPGIEATLSMSTDGTLRGNIANRTGVALTDCLLLHGNWAYRLTTLNDGAVREIDQPRQASTVLTSPSSGDDADARTNEYGEVVYDPSGADVTRICNSMMFYDIVGGKNYTGRYNRYQSFVDLSRLLSGKQAILVARAPSGTQWRRGDATLSSDQDRRWTFYRFIIPLQE